jgi:hypothetical protein
MMKREKGERETREEESEKNMVEVEGANAKSTIQGRKQ